MTGAGVALRFEEGYRTHRGTVRAINEDALVARLQAGLWAVADGMGGHDGGQWASDVIARSLDTVPLPEPIHHAAEAVAAALAKANLAIWRRSVITGAPVGSTVATLLIRDDRFVVLWAGDSRVYRQRDGQLQQLTTDHSQVERLVASGLIERSEVAQHPLRNVLSRSVGTAPAVQLDRVEGEIAGGDLFLLCSDGLTGAVTEREISGLLRAASPERAAQLMLDQALERGATDNVTVTIVGCEQATRIGDFARLF